MRALKYMHDLLYSDNDDSIHIDIVMTIKQNFLSIENLNSVLKVFFSYFF